ncbi:hypothetical protein ONZ45_g2844 [Pleurotus djamor]|nr:hypothetical protein ONZ45_g2844 [Pleurotus djamor]
MFKAALLLLKVYLVAVAMSVGNLMIVVVRNRITKRSTRLPQLHDVDVEKMSKGFPYAGGLFLASDDLDEVEDEVRLYQPPSLIPTADEYGEDWEEALLARGIASSGLSSRDSSFPPTPMSTSQSFEYFPTSKSPRNPHKLTPTPIRQGPLSRSLTYLSALFYSSASSSADAPLFPSFEELYLHQHNNFGQDCLPAPMTLPSVPFFKFMSPELEEEAKAPHFSRFVQGGDL